MRWMDSISKDLSIPKIYDSGKKIPRTYFMYLLICHSKTYNRNYNVRNSELILQCFSQYLESRSYHHSQLLLITIILWISGSPARLVWDNPEPGRKRHIYLSYHRFSGLSYSHKSPGICVHWNDLDVWLLRSGHIVRGGNRKQCEGTDLQFPQHTHHSLTLTQSCDLMTSVSQNSFLQRV